MNRPDKSLTSCLACVYVSSVLLERKRLLRCRWGLPSMNDSLLFYVVAVVLPATTSGGIRSCLLLFTSSSDTCFPNIVLFGTDVLLRFLFGNHLDDLSLTHPEYFREFHFAILLCLYTHHGDKSSNALISYLNTAPVVTCTKYVLVEARWTNILVNRALSLLQHTTHKGNSSIHLSIIPLSTC